MKILQINSVSGLGSTGRITNDIASMLLSKGHESFIAYGRKKSVKRDSVIKIGSKFDVYYHVFITRFFDKHGYGSQKSTEDLTKKIDDINPDIIHLHNIHGYYLNIEILFNYLKKIKKPVVWTLHDCWAFTGHCTHFDYIGCEKWIKGCETCPLIKEYPSSMVDNSSLNYLKKKELFNSLENLTIITPSKWLAEKVKKSFLKNYPVKVINNGVDLKEFTPVKSDFRKEKGIDEKFIILGVANKWNESKGLDTFIRLGKELDENYQIILVGENNNKSKIPKNIILIDKTDTIKELAKIYSAADVFLNPTLQDTYPTTNMEALACGTPVVTFDTGGSVEMIDESCGVIVGKNDFDDLVFKLKKIKETNFISEENCLKKSKSFNKNDKYLLYFDLYKGVYL